jgi:hypothetical protein
MLLPRQRKMRLSLLLLYPVAQIFLICRHARTVFCDAPGWTMDIDSEVQGGNIHRVESLRQCRAAICVFFFLFFISFYLEQFLIKPNK